ncbi:MAG: ABC transporter transmembrane domain-containing protein, partial [Spirochaetaceae bacterium]
MTAYTEQEFSRRFDWGLWRKLLRYTWGYKKDMIRLAVVMVAVAAIDAVFPLFSKYAIDSFIVPGRSDGIWKLIAGYGAVTLVQALNVWLLIAIAGKIEMGLAYDLRKKGFARLQELSLSYYDRTPVGWLMARMTSDNQKLSEIISWGLVDGVWGAVSMAAFAGVMLVLNWKLALIVLVVLPPLVIASGYFQKRILESHRKVRKLNSEISGAYNEGILGARTTKALSREGENLHEFTDLTGRMRRASIRTAVFSALYLPVVLMLGSIGTGLALWIGGAGVAAGGAGSAAAAAGGTSAGAVGIGLLGRSITYGTLVAFISYTVQFFEPVRELARILTELQSAQAAAERVISMIETEPEIKDSPEVEAVYGTTFAPHRAAWEAMGGRVDFEDVTFTYPDGETVLEN